MFPGSPPKSAEGFLQATNAALAAAKIAATHISIGPAAGARAAARAASKLGPNFVKLAQLAATRGDVLPSEYVAELANLRSAAPPHPRSAFEDNLRKRLGMDPLEVFVEPGLDPEPLACASLAQVHLGTLRNTGERVAVKILRPEVEAAAERDMEAVRALASLARGGGGRQMETLIARQTASIQAELDLLREAGAAKRLAAGLELKMPGLVRIPRVIDAFCTTGVCVMEYVPSRAIDAQGAALAFEALLVQAAFCGEFHCDPHEGNMGVDERGRLVIYDFGNVAPMPPEAVRTLFEAGAALAFGRHDEAGRHLLSRGLAAASDPASEAFFADTLQAAKEYAKDGDIRRLAKSSAEADPDAANGLELGNELSALVRSIGMTEGMCKRLIPGFSVDDAGAAFLRLHGAELLFRVFGD